MAQVSAGGLQRLQARVQTKQAAVQVVEKSSGRTLSAAMAEYPDIVRRVLGVPDSLHLICGVALGYADHDHPVNGYRTEREPLENFVQWHE